MQTHFTSILFLSARGIPDLCLFLLFFVFLESQSFADADFSNYFLILQLFVN